MYSQEAIKTMIGVSLSKMQEDEAYQYLQSLGQWIIRKVQLIESKHKAENVEIVVD